jgi:hypothetical protein
LAISGLTHHSKYVRFYSTLDLVNALKQETALGKARLIAMSLPCMDLVILDELGYFLFSQARGALLFLHHQLDFCRVVQRVWRYQDDHGLAGLTQHCHIKGDRQ